MNELKLVGTKIIGSNEVKVIEGGFGKNQKVLLASDIAIQHGVELKHLQQLINRNKIRFNENDLVNLCDENFKVTASDLGLISSNVQKYCYLLSERGYTKLVSMMSNDNDTKWEVMDRIIDEYFTMREVINNNAFTFEMFSNTLPVMLETIMGTVGNAMVENNKHIYEEINKVREEGKSIINDIEVKHEEQLKRTTDLIGMRTRNTMSITKLMKNKLSELKGMNVYANDYHYTLLKSKLFLTYNVSTFEQIPVKFYNDIFATIDSLESINDIIEL